MRDYCNGRVSGKALALWKFRGAPRKSRKEVQDASFFFLHTLRKYCGKNCNVTFVILDEGHMVLTYVCLKVLCTFCCIIVIT